MIITVAMTLLKVLLRVSTPVVIDSTTLTVVMADTVLILLLVSSIHGLLCYSYSLKDCSSPQ
jgi:hypothetical protein